MVMKSLCIVLVCFVMVKGQGFAPAGQIPLRCFECLCEASSECNLETDCFSPGPGQYHCGPYHISYAYWKDGGSPGANPEDPLDFEKCLTAPACAEAAIRGYMSRWSRDCDGDGSVDCRDYALLHKGGPDACNTTYAQTSDFMARFEACDFSQES